MSRDAAEKIYDAEYFERWYRDPRYAVIHQEVLARRVQLAIANAEFVLERPIRNVLDVGCGEGPWQPLIKLARPKASYVGMDSSEYAVKRYGKSRNLKLGSFGDVGNMGFKGSFDLIVCSDVFCRVRRVHSSVRRHAPKVTFDACSTSVPMMCSLSVPSWFICETVVDLQ